MTMKKYLAANHNRIEVVEIARESSTNVWVVNNKTGGNVTMHRKRTADGWYDFFDTLEEAKEHILNNRKQEIELAERRIQTAKEIIARIEAMQ